MAGQLALVIASGLENVKSSKSRFCKELKTCVATFDPSLLLDAARLALVIAPVLPTGFKK